MRFQYASCIPTLYTQLGGGWRDQQNDNLDANGQPAIPEPKE